MSEPFSGTAAAGAAGWKVIGGAAGALGFGAAFAAVVVMLTTEPRSRREWAVGLISTVIGSIAGGAYAIIKFDFLRSVVTAPDDLSLFFMLCAALGFAFACGLPAWAVVRLVFNYFAKKQAQGADVRDIVKDVKELV